jgi:hypothetical protein
MVDCGRPGGGAGSLGGGEMTFRVGGALELRALVLTGVWELNCELNRTLAGRESGVADAVVTDGAGAGYVGSCSGFLIVGDVGP